MRLKITYFIVPLFLFSLAACNTTESQRINLSNYSPVIDVEGEGKEIAQYNKDIEACRKLGLQVQATYEERRAQEQKSATQTAIVSTLAGAALGHVVGSNNDYHTGRSTTTGAIYGGAIGGALGSEGIDYDREIAKFGPTIIVDKCMVQRGWNPLSSEGLGGG